MKLIDVDKLKDYLCEGCDSIACDGNGKDSRTKCYTIYVIDKQPTFDVEKLASDAYKEGWSDSLDWVTVAYGIKFEPIKRGRVDGYK